MVLRRHFKSAGGGNTGARRRAAGDGRHAEYAAHAAGRAFRRYEKRVGLARALAMQPQMVFYDEPTSGLDPVMTMTISRLIRKTQQTLGVTSVLVTHDMESAYYAADRIAMLYDGRIVQVGTVAEIKKQ